MQQVLDALRGWTTQAPRLEPILAPMFEWVESIISPVPPPLDAQPSTLSEGHIVDSLLVICQNLVPETSVKDNLDSVDDGDGFGSMRALLEDIVGGAVSSIFGG